jgi:hypothetical protein
MSTPCGWAVTGCGCGATDWDTLPAAVATYAESVACQVMWAATGRQYGLCEITVRPCTRSVAPLYVDYPVNTYASGVDYPVAYVDNGQWHNTGCSDACTCTAGCEVALDGPTTKANITSVTVAGVVVDPSAYEVHNGYLLVRTDGTCWPTCHDYSQPTEAFQVVYSRGQAIPTAVQQATNRFACELAKACQGADCGLPNRVRSLTRQGVEVQMVDLTDDTGRITTGIPEVDTLITAENPHGLQQPAMVLTPDLPGPRRIT